MTGPGIAVRAPGRVNLIGDHTDYNDGFVLPVAVQLECVIRGVPADGVVRLRSTELDEAAEVVLAEVGDPRSVEPSWGRYVAGVVAALVARGRPVRGVDGVVSSTVPVGSGLSSSAALEVAVALALGADLPPAELASACRDAEEAATGVPCGIMDQLAAVCGRAGCALLIDCRSLAVEAIPLPNELAIVVVHSGLPRSLDSSPYAERRRACERAAARLGLAALRDATADQVADDPRARHVVSENGRVLAAADALRRGDVAALGPLLSASHASLRDDFAVSTPELDALVAALERAGALGARLTGAGFGGCVVALAPRADAERIARDAAADYRETTGREPAIYDCRAVDGAGPVGSGRRGP
jgi:galactokinase